MMRKQIAKDTDSWRGCGIIKLSINLKGIIQCDRPFVHTFSQKLRCLLSY